MTQLKKNKSGVLSTLIAIFIFLIPSNLFYKLTTESAYVNGILSDYLIPKLFLSDIVILIFVLTALFFNDLTYKKIIKELYQNNKKYIFLTLFLIFFPMPIFSSHITLLLILRLFIFCLFTHLFYIHSDQIISKYIINSVLFTLFFQSALAIAQYIKQDSLFNYLFLGEPDLSSYAGITKQMLFGELSILPYGTTAHPNVLGGVLALFILISIVFYKKINTSNLEKVFFFLTILISSIALFLTQSLSAWLSLLLGITVFFIFKYTHWFKKLKKTFSLQVISSLLILTIVLIPICVNLLANQPKVTESIARRAYLNEAGIRMFIDNPILGVGYGNFTRHVENYSNEREVVRFVQPAHHVAILFLAEWGIVGVALLFLVTSKVWKQLTQRQRRNLLLTATVLLPILSMDHYLYTLQSGQLLFILSLIFLKKKL